VGVITTITLSEINAIFPSYNFTKITPTSDGVMDTTYILHTQDSSFILKKYERQMGSKIEKDRELLKTLSSAGLNVPLLLDSNKEWYLYKKLDGKVPTNIETYHIQALARFMAKLHSQTKKMPQETLFITNYKLDETLLFTKKNFFSYYKKLQTLQTYRVKNDGFIHGDIFKDNTVFDGSKIGVFDFIDGGYGEFSFDIAVALVAFNGKKHPLFVQLFLNTYNQKAPKKIAKDELLSMMTLASNFYALLRIQKYKNTKKAKELL